jgi:hypothetical protein
MSEFIELNKLNELISLLLWEMCGNTGVVIRKSSYMKIPLNHSCRMDSLGGMACSRIWVQLNRSEQVCPPGRDH